MDYWQKIRQALGHETIILSGAAAILQEGKILLARHGALKNWYIPGGLQEQGESIQDTVCREIKEELGLELVVDKLISIYSNPKWITEYPNGDKVQQLLFFFRMKGDLGEIKLQRSEVLESA
jgi:ADP-ribose pyrophosphatase YjhB (NUDIX family)